MNILLWLTLVYSISLEARNRPDDKLSDDDILEALSELISGEDETRIERQVEEFAETFSQSEDQFQPFAPFEKCDLVGYEFRKKEECKEVSEVDCALANVTKTRTELVKKCHTVIEQKCEEIMTEVPQQYCQQRLKNK